MIKGCACDRAISVDNQYYLDYSEIIDDSSYNATIPGMAYFSQQYLTKFFRYAFLSFSSFPYSLIGVLMLSLRLILEVMPVRRCNVPRVILRTTLLESLKSKLLLALVIPERSR
jgi:hypothetical protein